MKICLENTTKFHIFHLVDIKSYFIEQKDIIEIVSFENARRLQYPTLHISHYNVPFLRHFHFTSTFLLSSLCSSLNIMTSNQTLCQNFIHFSYCFCQTSQKGYSYMRKRKNALLRVQNLENMLHHLGGMTAKSRSTV